MSRIVSYAIMFLLFVSMAQANYNRSDHSDLEYNITFLGVNATIADGFLKLNSTVSSQGMARIVTQTRALTWTNITDKPFTISGWFLIPNNSSSTKAILENSNYNSGCPGGWGVGCGGWLMRVEFNRLLFQAVVNNATYALAPRNCQYRISWTNDNQWHHGTITHNGTRGAPVKIYLDGTERSQLAPATCTEWETGLEMWGNDRNTALGIGEDPNHSGVSGNWSVDDVRFWTKELTPEEVYSVYLNEMVEMDSLAAWYPFNESKMNAVDYVNPCSYDGSGSWNLTTSCTITRNYTIPGPVRFGGDTTVFSANLISAKNVVFLSNATIFQNGARMVTTG